MNFETYVCVYEESEKFAISLSLSLAKPLKFSSTLAALKRKPYMLSRVRERRELTCIYNAWKSIYVCVLEADTVNWSSDVTIMASEREREFNGSSIVSLPHCFRRSFSRFEFSERLLLASSKHIKIFLKVSYRERESEWLSAQVLAVRTF